MASERCTIVVIGQTDSAGFQLAKTVAEAIGKHYPRDIVCEVQQLTELEWLNHYRRQEQVHGSIIREITQAVLVTVDGVFQPSADAFVEWANSKKYFPTPDGFDSSGVDYAAQAQVAYAAFLAIPEFRFVYFDVTIDNEDAGKMVFKLEHKLCPKTTANFVALCVGYETQNKPNLNYSNTIFHRLQSDGWIQGGDLHTAPGNAPSLSLDGDKGSSLYGDVFEDENYIVKHDDFGVLAMANNQTDSNNQIHSNASQFTISFRGMQWMDKRYVAFGKLVSGVAVLKKLQHVPVANGRPTQTCKIVKCGSFSTTPDIVTNQTVQVTTASVADGGTASTVYASFYLHGSWTVPVFLFKGAASGDVKKTVLSDVFSAASMIRLSISTFDEDETCKFGCASLSWNGKSVSTETHWVSSDKKIAQTEISL